jgi:hypothetical protein
MLPRFCTILGTLFICSISTAACDREQNRAVAENAAAQLRSARDVDEYHRIFKGADPDLHRVTSESDFLHLLQTRAENLGKPQRSVLTTLKEDWSFRGTVLTALFDTEFEKARATEQIVWRVRAGKALLVGYRITSPALAAHGAGGQVQP